MSDAAVTTALSAAFYCNSGNATSLRGSRVGAGTDYRRASAALVTEAEVALKFAYGAYQQGIDFLGQFLFRNDPEAIELS